MKKMLAKRRGSMSEKLDNAQAVRHWAAMTVARAEELRLVGLNQAADSLKRLARSMKLV